jgi:predicted PurR-regulated permease PerM
VKELKSSFWCWVRAILLLLFVLSPIIFYFIDQNNHILESWGIYLQSWFVLLASIVLFVIFLFFVLILIVAIVSAQSTRRYSYLFQENDER